MLSPGGRPAWADRLLRDVNLRAVAGNIESFGRDDRWLEENIGIFRRDFPGQFIAVRDCRVVGWGGTLQEARRKAASAGTDPAKCVIRLILAEEPEWIL